MSIYSDILTDALPRLAGLSVLDYVAGVNYTAVRTEAGVGLAYTFTGDIRPDSPLFDKDFTGTPAEEAARLYLSRDPLASAFGLAVINSALSAQAGLSQGDAITDMIPAGAVVGMVGYFKPIVPKILDNVRDLFIFELKEQEGVFSPFEAPHFMPMCDFVIITGSTLANRTISDYLPHIAPDATVVILGPSTPLSPVLARRATLMGSYVRDAEEALRIVSRGGGRRMLDNVITPVFMERGV